jgi:cell division protein FtsL
MATQTTRTRPPQETGSGGAPPHPRRVSGPLRPLPAGAPPLRRGGTGVFERLRGLPEHRMVDRLLRGRVWIWLIGVLLGGIVAMQVSLLKLNAGISRAVTTTTTLEQQNAGLEEEIARLSSSERIKAAATKKAMVMPPAGDVGFLRARGADRDAARATNRMEPPSEEAAAVMANGGREPGVLATPAPTTVSDTTAPVTTTETSVADTTTQTTTTAPTDTTTPPTDTTTPPTDTTTPPTDTTTPPTDTTTPATDTGAATAPQG